MSILFHGPHPHFLFYISRSPQVLFPLWALHERKSTGDHLLACERAVSLVHHMLFTLQVRGLGIAHSFNTYHSIATGQLGAPAGRFILELWFDGTGSFLDKSVSYHLFSSAFPAGHLSVASRPQIP